MTWGDCIGWTAVVGIWAGIVWVLVQVMAFTRPDSDPDD